MPGNLGSRKTKIPGPIKYNMNGIIAQADLNKDGAAGKASRASAEKGEAILAHAVRGLSELVADMAKFDVSELD